MQTSATRHGVQWIGKKVLKELNDPNLDVVKRSLRRIHLRWYHATAPQMIRLLEMIGCPESTLKLGPDIARRAECAVLGLAKLLMSN